MIAKAFRLFLTSELSDYTKTSFLKQQQQQQKTPVVRCTGASGVKNAAHCVTSTWDAHRWNSALGMSSSPLSLSDIELYKKKKKRVRQICFSFLKRHVLYKYILRFKKEKCKEREKERDQSKLLVKPFLIILCVCVCLLP